MELYPLFYDIAGRECLVVGGGRVALRKAVGLLRAKARVTAVSKEFVPGFGRLRAVARKKRAFSENDVSPGLALVIGATGSDDVDAAIARRARKLNIPCNIVDKPELCSFVVPAVLRRGPLTVAISTGGGSPYLARHLKTRIGSVVGPEYGRLADFLSRLRAGVKRSVPEAKARQRFWREFFEVDPMACVSADGWDGLQKRADGLLAKRMNGQGAR
jgi:siroheme synthase-like protein